MTFVTDLEMILNILDCWVPPMKKSWFFDQMLVLAPEDKVRLQDYCAVSVFVKILMLRGYSFDETTFQHISFQKKV